MKRVILESPYSGNVEKNVAYAKLCIKDMLMNNEAPIASHLLFTQPGILDDLEPEERKLGIKAGHIWMAVADYVVFYVDLGYSNGMLEGLKSAELFGISVFYRKLPNNILDQFKLQYPD